MNSCSRTVIDSEGYVVDGTTVTATYDSVTAEAAEVAVKLSSSDRVALEAFYRAAGGDDWNDKTNWLSNEPLGDWYGVMVGLAASTRPHHDRHRDDDSPRC